MARTKKQSEIEEQKRLNDLQRDLEKFDPSAPLKELQFYLNKHVGHSKFEITSVDFSIDEWGYHKYYFNYGDAELMSRFKFDKPFIFFEKTVYAVVKKEKSNLHIIKK